jgi:hypothetical protein
MTDTRSDEFEGGDIDITQSDGPLLEEQGADLQTQLGTPEHSDGAGATASPENAAETYITEVGQQAGRYTDDAGSDSAGDGASPADDGPTAAELHEQDQIRSVDGLGER